MHTLIVGGGIAGLVATAVLREKDPSGQITLIERAPLLGGVLAGVEYPAGRPGTENGPRYFDHGTHLFRESGCQPLDDRMKAAVSADDLLLYAPGVGGWAGSVYCGTLQEHSHYPDVRRHPEAVSLKRAIDRHIESSPLPAPIERSGPLAPVARARFGERYADTVLLPALAAMFRRPADTLAGFALQLPGYTRLIADDAQTWSRRTQDKHYREIVAVPDQRVMPDALVNPLRRFYARHRGTRSFVDGLRQQLEAAGAKLLTGTVLESCDIHTRRAHWRTPDGCAHEVPFDRLVFATGPMGAVRLCGIDPMSYGFERPLEHRIVNIALDAPTRSDLSYFYALDPEDAYFRVTNYRSFSGDADDTRLSIEVLSDPGADVPPVDRILTRLRAIGFLDRQRPIFTAVETLAAGFPLPTTNNMQAMARINADLLAVCPPHVQICGVGSGDGNFFQTEVLVDVYRRLMA